MCPSVIRPSIFSFPDDNLSKCQWIFTKLNVSIDIVEIWFGVVDEQISSIFDSYLSAICLYFHFQMITLVNTSEFSPNLVCALILWRPGLGLLMSEFRQFLTELSARHMSVFAFLDDNFSKCQWIFPKLGICINIMEICFGIANGQILPIFDRVICPQYIPILLSGIRTITSKSQWLFTKFDVCIYIVEICFGIAYWQILSIFDSYLPVTW